MKCYFKEDIESLDRKERLKLINAVSGVKPGNLIGTADRSGNTNLAVFSSVVHLGSDPALLGMIVRPVEEVPRHTYRNILETGYYTINHIHPSFVEKAHYTSAKFDDKVSEFERCGLDAEFRDGFAAPFVKQSQFKMGMGFLQDIEIPQNKTHLIIGEIQQLIIPDDAFSGPEIDLEKTEAVGISGLNSYYRLIKLADFPYAREKEVPRFGKKDGS
ncbi:flavin reductase family protein [Robertkochia aurantiaca]|uniref:flavin reductase family protein n=1 Tax=Robertkochia aurantiaca TaxID=2873700 RepID=UPI001CCAB9E7|nr:flavin reductase [Robertkochia sp. 3YJGBD-33]